MKTENCRNLASIQTVPSLSERMYANKSLLDAVSVPEKALSAVINVSKPSGYPIFYRDEQEMSSPFIT